MARWTWYDRRKRAMADQKASSRGDKELQEAILREKAKGTPDVEIGRKYGVTFGNRRLPDVLFPNLGFK